MICDSKDNVIVGFEGVSASVSSQKINFINYTGEKNDQLKIQYERLFNKHSA